MSGPMLNESSELSEISARSAHPDPISKWGEMDTYYSLGSSPKLENRIEFSFLHPYIIQMPQVSINLNITEWTVRCLTM